MDRACKHGYLECPRCVDEADERARKVAEYYAAEQSRPVHPHDQHTPEGHTLQKSAWPYGELIYYKRPPEVLRCECGSRLQAPEAMETGRCYYCRTGTETPWDSRCPCGSGLMGKESIASGKCSNCRTGHFDDV